MPKLVVELQQNTPMIHFQAGEAGATLRATAVKPALDRFLIEICKSEPDIKSWMHDTTNKAFDYRMTFQAEDSKVIKNRALKKYNNAQMPYFADSDGVMCSQPVKMTIISAKSDLLNTIRENIAAFFLLHNFGVRATKGYGSFQVVSTQMVSIDEKPVAVTCTEKAIWDAVALSSEFALNLYKLPNTFNNNWGAALADINSIYAQMKSGSYPIKLKQNQSEVPSEEESDVEYLLLDSEKWWIKQEFGSNAQSSSNDSAGAQNNEPEVRFLRAMLGLSGFYRVGKNGGTVNVADNPKKNAANNTADNAEDNAVNYYSEDNAADQNKGIQRFASPLIFKPVRIGERMHVYILVKKIPDVMFGREFDFKYGRSTKTLKTPNQEEFSLVDFMNYVAGNGGGRLINKVEAGGEGR